MKLTVCLLLLVAFVVHIHAFPGGDAAKDKVKGKVDEAKGKGKGLEKAGDDDKKKGEDEDKPKHKKKIHHKKPKDDDDEPKKNDDCEEDEKPHHNKKHKGGKARKMIKPLEQWEEKGADECDSFLGGLGW